MRTLVAFLLLAVGVACAHTPRAIPARELEARTFTPADGKARVYLYRRTHMYLLTCRFSVGDVRATVGPNAFMMVEVDPGAHVVGWECANDTQMQPVTITAGELYFGIIDALGPSDRAFRQVPEAEGRAAVEKYVMAWSSEMGGADLVGPAPASVCTGSGPKRRCVDPE